MEAAGGGGCEGANGVPDRRQRNRSEPDDDADPIWDSGKVDSDQSVWVAYEGPRH